MRPSDATAICCLVGHQKCGCCAHSVVLVLNCVSCDAPCGAVDGGHRAVLFDRFRGVLPETVGEGTHFLIPWLQKPYIYDVRTRPRSITSVTGTKGESGCNPLPRLLWAILRRSALSCAMYSPRPLLLRQRARGERHWCPQARQQCGECTGALREGTSAFPLNRGTGALKLGTTALPFRPCSACRLAQWLPLLPLLHGCIHSSGLALVGCTHDTVIAVVTFISAATVVGVALVPDFGADLQIVNLTLRVLLLAMCLLACQSVICYSTINLKPYPY